MVRLNDAAARAMAQRLNREARKLQAQWSRDPMGQCGAVLPGSRFDVTPTRCLLPRHHRDRGLDHRHQCGGLNISWSVRG